MRARRSPDHAEDGQRGGGVAHTTVFTPLSNARQVPSPQPIITHDDDTSVIH
jgi:hypothetical protein